MNICVMRRRQVPINLASYEDFRRLEWLSPLISKYRRDSVVAEYAVTRLVTDIRNIKRKYADEYNRVLFTTVEGRMKSEDSFFRKLYNICCNKAKIHGLSPVNLKRFYAEVQDIAGVRFACPYYDDVETTVNEIILPELGLIGYAIELGGKRYKPKNYLDTGDEFGYRSYHFFVKTPTQIDIFKNVRLFPCEVQGRSELQHVWAVKSHDLLYKPKDGWKIQNKDVIEDMRQVSNSLRVADQFLVSIRNRVDREREQV